MLLRRLLKAVGLETVTVQDQQQEKSESAEVNIHEIENNLAEIVRITAINRVSMQLDKYGLRLNSNQIDNIVHNVIFNSGIGGIYTEERIIDDTIKQFVVEEKKLEKYQKLAALEYGM